MYDYWGPPEQPTSLELAEAVFGETAVRALISDGLVTVHDNGAGGIDVDWTELNDGLQVWNRWGNKRKAARHAAMDCAQLQRWLAGLLEQRERQVREQIKLDARRARWGAIQANFAIPVTVTATGAETTMTMDDLLAES